MPRPQLRILLCLLALFVAWPGCSAKEDEEKSGGGEQAIAVWPPLTGRNDVEAKDLDPGEIGYLKVQVEYSGIFSPDISGNFVPVKGQAQPQGTLQCFMGKITKTAHFGGVEDIYDERMGSKVSAAETLTSGEVLISLAAFLDAPVDRSVPNLYEVIDFGPGHVLIRLDPKKNHSLAVSKDTAGDTVVTAGWVGSQAEFDGRVYVRRKDGWYRGNERLTLRRPTATPRQSTVLPAAPTPPPAPSRCKVVGLALNGTVPPDGLLPLTLTAEPADRFAQYQFMVTVRGETKPIAPPLPLTAGLAALRFDVATLALLPGDEFKLYAHVVPADPDADLAIDSNVAVFRVVGFEEYLAIVARKRRDIIAGLRRLRRELDPASLDIVALEQGMDPATDAPTNRDQFMTHYNRCSELAGETRTQVNELLEVAGRVISGSQAMAFCEKSKQYSDAVDREMAVLQEGFRAATGNKKTTMVEAGTDARECWQKTEQLWGQLATVTGSHQEIMDEMAEVLRAPLTRLISSLQEAANTPSASVSPLVLARSKFEAERASMRLAALERMADDMVGLLQATDPYAADRLRKLVAELRRRRVQPRLEQLCQPLNAGTVESNTLQAVAAAAESLRKDVDAAMAILNTQ